MTTTQDFPDTQPIAETHGRSGVGGDFPQPSQPTKPNVASAGEAFQQPSHPTEPNVGSAAGIFHQPMADTEPVAVAVDEVPGTQRENETQRDFGAGEDFHQPMTLSKPSMESADDLPDTQQGLETHAAHGVGEDFHQSSTNAKPKPRSAGGTPDTQGEVATHDIHGVRGDFIDLRIWAESYWDIQTTRIALEQRMKRGGVDADLLEGHLAGLYASENAFRKSMVRSYRRLVRKHMPAVEEWQKANHGIGEHLMARLFGVLGHPVHANPYEKMTEAPEGHKCIKGVCGKTHLVALQPFLRSPGQLWAYCGHGEALKRRKGMTQAEALMLGSPRCKTLMRLIAEGTIKVKGVKTHTNDDFDPAVHTCYCDKCGPQPSGLSIPNQGSAGATENTPLSLISESTEQAAEPDSGTDPMRAPEPISRTDRYRYRSIYDTRKVSTADRIDDEGKPWTDGHRHSDALRIVGKKILLDIWIAAGGGQDG